MAVNWLRVLEEQRDNAREMAASTMALLTKPDFTQDEVTRIHTAAQDYAQAFARIMGDLKEHEVDEVILEMARGIEALWNTILAAITRHFDVP